MKTKKAAAGKGRVSSAAKEINSLRNVAPGRHWAAWRLTGTFNGATAFQMLQSGGQIDIFREAAKYPADGDNPYNNWLTAERKPRFTVYAEAVGVYLSNRLGDGKVPVKAILAEHALLDLKNGAGASLCKQPLITLPSGFSIQEHNAITNTAVDRRVAESFGPLSPMGMFKLPKDTVFGVNEQVSATLKVDPAAVAELMAMTGTLPGAGAIIAVCIFGPGALRIGTTR
ncbi:hypothetical protein [Myxococcus stipitatus]|uniref:hypothetical protein n=1 Tax=Myxococcus stipitatus TaxID=83455 RepID=UPI0030D4C963